MVVVFPWNQMNASLPIYMYIDKIAKEFTSNADRD